MFNLSHFPLYIHQHGLILPFFLSQTVARAAACQMHRALPEGALALLLRLQAAVEASDGKAQVDSTLHQAAVEALGGGNQLWQDPIG